MKIPRTFVACVLLPITLLSGVARAQAPATGARTERAQVEAFLRNWQRTHLVSDADFDVFKPMGERVLPLLSMYLADKDLGYLAESAMVHLDTQGAMPFLLKSLSAKDPNVQRDTFRLANRQLMEYDWYVRAGKPKVDPAQPAPRYPRNTQPYPYRKAMHAAAVQALQAGDITGSQSQAILTIGLTGSASDFPLLRKWAAKADTGAWEGNYHALAIAALARLGDKAALATIAAELAQPVPPQPAQPYIRDGLGEAKRIEPQPGAVVASRQDSQRLRTVAFQAGFTMNRRFIPLLLRHLDDPTGQFHGDYGDPSPADEAMTALSQIVCGDEYWQQTGRSPEQWKQWGRDQGFVAR